MRHDDRDLRATLHRAGEDEVCDRPCRVKGELEHRAGMVETTAAAKARGRWVDEDRRASPVQFIEHWIETRIAEIDAERVCLELDPVRSQLIQRMLDLAK